MKTTKLACLAMYCGLLAVPAALAQEWSPAQTEVWKNVEAYWARAAAGDLEGALSYAHENYIGWDLSDPVTHNKSRLRKFLDYSFKTEKTELHDIQPVAINIFDDVAIVYYYFIAINKDADSEVSYLSGRSTDVLMKQNNKWLVIGDHGGVTSEE